MIGPMLTHGKSQFEHYITTAGEPISEIFFIEEGTAGFVLADYQNFTYLTAEEDQCLGLVDLV